MPHKHPHKTKTPAKKHVIDKLIFMVAFLQPLGTIPQIIAIYSRHDAHSISLLSWGIYVFFDLMWLWYGITDKQKAVIVSASMFTILEGTTMIGAILYGGTL